ncbi:hypothetical protein [Stackebrandtia soli]|uniref:hypothetical protein n=1 Tax=Stackebrandtia soli TaxID=1892856 RepID=UPI0039ECC41C
MMINTKRLFGLVAGVALVAGLAACNDDPKSDDPTVSESSPVEETEDVPTLDPSEGIEDEEKETAMTLTGKIESGVESGCVLLEQDGTLYNLVGGDRQVLTAGASVEVTGTVNKGLMTTCQQGTPFQVDSVKAA